jgi:hemerythrin
MALIKWTSALSVAIPEIDVQHQKLVSLINQLHDAMLSGKGREVLGGVLSELVDYTKIHFAREEDLLRRNNYPDYPRHKKIHEELTFKVVNLKREFESGEPVLTLDVMKFLQHWLTGHIEKSDKQYSPYIQ